MRTNRSRRHLPHIERLEVRLCLSGIGFARHGIDGQRLGGSAAMITADLDGDGDLDLVSGNIHWRPNDGHGKFGENRIVSTQTGSADQILAADIDGDGDNDIVSFSNRDDELAWFENRDGKGRFGPKQTVDLTAGYSRSLMPGDMDGDGDLDLVSFFSSISQHSLIWYDNTNGQGTYRRHQISDNVLPGFAIVDLDDDGDLDVLTGKSWFEYSDGNATFVQRPPLNRQMQGFAKLSSHDVDNNGRLDVFYDGIWYEATEDPTQFTLRQELAPGNATIPGDIDGDGDLDMISVYYGVDHSRLSWHELQEDGRYTLGKHVAIGSLTDFGLIVSDLNGDDRDDLLYYNGTQEWIDVERLTSWRVYESETGTFGPEMPLADSFLPASALAIADIDGDSDLDLINASYDLRCGIGTCSRTISWSENLGAADSFGPRTYIADDERVSIRDAFTRLWPWDVDRDGDVDILARSSSDAMWFENLDGRGRFGDAVTILRDMWPDDRLLVEDFDQDGRVELLHSSHRSESVTFWRYDDVERRFVASPLETDWTTTRINDMVAGDIDGDSDLDVVVSGYMPSGRRVFAWYEYGDQGEFGRERNISTERPVHSPAPLVDFDGDGDLDLVVSSVHNGQSVLAWIENRDGGDFINLHEITAPASFSSEDRDRTLQDLDGDGHVDLILRSHGKLIWYHNDGQGRFGLPLEIEMGPGEYVVGDLDQDGDIDIATSLLGMTWHENRPIGDANDDGRFDAADLLIAFQAGKYEDEIPLNTPFAEGDWNGDGDFTSADLVLAFKSGMYLANARIATNEIAAAVDLLFATDDDARRLHVP